MKLYTVSHTFFLTINLSIIVYLNGYLYIWMNIARFKYSICWVCLTGNYVKHTQQIEYLNLAISYLPYLIDSSKSSWTNNSSTS